LGQPDYQEDKFIMTFNSSEKEVAKAAARAAYDTVTDATGSAYTAATTIPPVTERDIAIAKTLIGQIAFHTLLGQGFRFYTAITCGAILDFQLARPYGHRTMTITLNPHDYYDVTTYRTGRNGSLHLVSEINDVDNEQLDRIVWSQIAKSCD
jgi:hypothetical protein